MTPSHQYIVLTELTQLNGNKVTPRAHSNTIYATDRDDAVQFIKHVMRHAKPVVFSARRVTSGGNDE